MICWAVASSLGTRGLESVWPDPVNSIWDEEASRPAAGSDRGMSSIAYAAEKKKVQNSDVIGNMN